ncbi:hypothetical protein DERP_002378 [Dermatophagoides pteronyssinus]|uniref:Uncharacterized protein n=1 Tax=Dermatophagoides pteronyssinus TaxID=6956 RepID=A0ABQ8JHJ7_DERPT|nr:hypothetical protein DERP_002378 [Dermatophagoides pteronyssinus]
MYGLYLKYFHRNNDDDDKDDKNGRCKPVYRIEEKAIFPKNLKNESIPFQLIFFTVTGGNAGMLLFFVYYPIRRLYQSGFEFLHNRHILVERIVRPFCLTTLASYLVSFAAGVAYVSYNNSKNENQKLIKDKN